MAYLVLAVLAASPLAAAAADSDGLVQIIRELQKIRVEAIDTVVPLAARPLLTSLKHKLRDLILDTLNAEFIRPTPVNEIRARLQQKLTVPAEVVEKAKACGEEEDGEACGYGFIPAIDVQRPRGHPNLLAVTTAVAVNCDSDNSLYIFRRGKTKWKLILALEAGDYEQISGALGTLRYVISPPGEQASFFVVAVDVPPWCTSFWRTIHYAVFRVGPTPYEPKVILDRTEDAYLGGSLAIYKLTFERRGFVLYWHSGHPFDLSLARLRVARYRIVGSRAIRIPPVAIQPEDFLGEWVRLSWDEAAKWSSRRARSRFQSWHERLNTLDCCSSDVMFVQACAKPLNTWQIGLQIGREKPTDPPPEELFFTIRRKGQTYYMQDIASMRPPGCPGETPPMGPDRRGWDFP